MDSFGRLAKLQLLKGGDVRTFAASDPETGLRVLLHLRRTDLLDRDFNKRLKKWLESDPAELLDRGEHEGQIYIVTEFTSSKQTLIEIISRFDDGATAAKPEPATVLSARPPEKLVAKKAVSAEPDLSGEETVFDGFPNLTVASQTSGPPIQTEIAREPALAKVEEPAPGEFTKMFGASGSAKDPEIAPAGTAAPPGKEPGEFTKMFSSPPEVRQDAVVVGAKHMDVRLADVRPTDVRQVDVLPADGKPANVPGTGPGEFTRLFGAPSNATGAGTMLNRAKVVPPEVTSRVDSEPEKTRLFSPGASASAQSTTSAAGSFTQLFRTPPKTPPSEPLPIGRAPIEPAGESAFGASSPGSYPKDLYEQGPYAGRGEREVDFRSLPNDSGRQQPEPNATSGEFTKMFGNPGEKPATGSPRSAAVDPNATNLFQAGRQASAPPLSQSGPGEYTRLFGSAEASGAQQNPLEPMPSKTSAQVTPAPTGNQKRLLIIAVAVLLLLALALILVMMMRQ